MNATTSINQQACAWIAKLHGEPSAKDLQNFRAWMAQSPAHKTEVRQLAKLWGELDVLTELAVVQEPLSTQSTSARLFDKVAALIKFSNWNRPLAAMVTATLVAVLALPIIIDINKTTYSTDIGEQELITLRDGSTVLLNTNSSIRVDYSLETRNISLLSGQAHFEVTKDNSRPFNVYAGKGLVRAVGTAFSVYLQPDIIEVTVTEGTIELSAVAPAPAPTNQPDNAQPVPPSKTITKLSLVTAGQNATMDQDTSSIDSIEVIDAPEIVQKLAWHQGLLRFSGDPLEDVVAEISRYTDLSIVILDPEIRHLRIGGFFKVGETEKMFQALETSFGVRVQRKGKNVALLAAASP